MADPTTNHSLDRMSRGDTNWHELYNSAIEGIDGQLELRGTLADRPAAADVESGTKYTVTSGPEAGAIYIESAGSWEQLPLESSEEHGVYVLDPDEDLKTELGSRLDEAGATIRLRPQTTYETSEDDITISSDEVAIVGPPSATISLADNTVDTDDTTPVILFEGVDGYLGSWTFDGNVQNQTATDRYGLKWADTATGWTVVGHRNLNACGDAYGNVRGGMRMSDVYCTGFTQDGIDYWATDEVQVSNSYFEGGIPIKSATRSGFSGFSGLKVSNTALIGDGSRGVWLSSIGSSTFTIEDFQFTNCHIHGEQWAAVMFESGEPDFTAENITFSNCHLTATSAWKGVRFHGSAGTFRDIRFENCSVGADAEAIYMTGGGHAVENLQWDGGTVDVGSNTAFVLDNVTDADVEPGHIAAASADATIASNCTDVSYEPQGNGVTDSGTRTLLGDWGTNDGDPSSTGEWAGEGREGVMVRDTTNGTNYVYVAGAWRTV